MSTLYRLHVARLSIYVLADTSAAAVHCVETVLKAGHVECWEIAPFWPKNQPIFNLNGTIYQHP